MPPKNNPVDKDVHAGSAKDRKKASFCQESSENGYITETGGTCGVERKSNKYRYPIIQTKDSESLLK